MLRNLFSRRDGTRTRRTPLRRQTARLDLEALEDRRLLAVNLVSVVRSFGLSTETFTATSPDVLDGVITPGTHRLMRFDFLSWNIGNQALAIGNPASRPELFVFSTSHGHYHLKDFNEYQLLDAFGNLVKPGFKQAFCAIDIEHRSTFGPPSRVYTDCNTNQGISSGWADVYSRSLPGQYIIMDGVADGVYQLRAFTNVSRKVVEDNYDDNVVMVTLRIQGTTVTQLTPTDIGNTISTAWNTSVNAGLDGIDIQSQIGAAPWAATTDVDMFRFDALGGTTVNLSTFLPAGGRAMDTYLRVFNSTGTQIGINDDCGASLYSCLPSLAIQATGTYYVGISGYPNSGYNPITGAGATLSPPERIGDYTLRIHLNNPSDVGETMATSFNTFMGPVSGRFSLTERIGNSNHGLWDVDMYRLQANAGTQLTAWTSFPGGRSMDTVLRVFNATGTPVASNDDCEGLYSCAVYNIPSTGTYYVGVSGYPNLAYSARYPGTGDAAQVFRLGDYRIELALTNGDFGDTLGTSLLTGVGPGASNAVVATQRLGNGPFGNRDVDLYRIEANVGTTLNTRTALPSGGTAMDTILRVFNSGGGQVAINDDCGSGYSCITHTFTASGPHYIGVSGYSNFTYNPNVGGSGVAGSVGDYRLTVSITDARGDIGDTLGAALVTGMGPGQSNYTMPSQPIGNGPNGRLDVDMYRFQAERGFRWSAQTALPAGGASMDTYLRLFDATGVQLAANDDCGGVYSCINNFTIPSTGTYYAGVSGFSNGGYNPNTANSGIPGSVGDYRLTMSLAAVPTTALRVVASTTTPIAGVPLSITVTALDGGGNPNPTYRGAVNFTSTDGAATLPANYTFTTADAGVHIFPGVILRTAGARSITARDTVTTTILGTANVTVAPAAASTLTLTGLPASVTAGVASSVTVTLRDAFNNLATGYTGIVTFSSTDGTATLPSNYTFTPVDGGTRLFPGVVLRTAGARSVTARDTVNGALTSTANTTVNPAAAHHYQVTPSSANVTAGYPFDLTVRVQDEFDNTVTGYEGTVTFTTSDPSGGTLPVDYTYLPEDAGVHNFAGETALYVAGPQAIYATDTVSAITGTADLTVDPDVAAFFYIEAPTNAVSGQPFDITVYAFDAYYNLATGYDGTVTFSTTDADPGVVVPADYTFDPLVDFGAHTFSGVTLVTEGVQSLYVVDTITFILGSVDIQVDLPGPGPGTDSGRGSRSAPADPQTAPAEERGTRPVADAERMDARTRLDGIAVDWLFAGRNRSERVGLFHEVPIG